jgi:hypothetical protein
VTTQQYRDLLLECLVTLRHASIFTRSREQMHPTGLELYDKLITDVESALKSPGPELHRFHQGEAGWKWHQGCGCANCQNETARIIAYQKSLDKRQPDSATEQP